MADTFTINKNTEKEIIALITRLEKFPEMTMKHIGTAMKKAASELEREQKEYGKDIRAASLIKSGTVKGIRSDPTAIKAYSGYFGDALKNDHHPLVLEFGRPGKSKQTRQRRYDIRKNYWGGNSKIDGEAAFPNERRLTKKEAMNRKPMKIGVLTKDFSHIRLAWKDNKWRIVKKVLEDVDKNLLDYIMDRS